MAAEATAESCAAIETGDRCCFDDPTRRVSMLRFALTLALLGVFVAPGCKACSCTVPVPAKCGVSLLGDHIFVGRVVDETPITRDGSSRLPGIEYAMHFKVEKSLVGDSGSEITIETWKDGCGFLVPVGGTYLISADKQSDGTLSTGMCNGNMYLKDAAAADTMIQFYEKLLTTGSVYGRVVTAEPVWRSGHVHETLTSVTVQGVTVRAAGDTGTVSTKTAGDGSYTLPGLAPGKYTVFPELAPNQNFAADHADPRYHPNLRAGECATIDFDLQPSTEIRGKLIFPPGVAPRAVDVDAVPIRPASTTEFTTASAVSDANGRFKLWPLPPGDYYVGANIANALNDSPPFPTTYYPSAPDQTNATIVHVAEGEVKDLEIALPAVPALRTLRVSASGLDGKPLAARLWLQIQDMTNPNGAASFLTIDVNPSGDGQVSIYAGDSYRVRASPARMAQYTIPLTWSRASTSAPVPS
jgi:hypothetical protein